MTPTENAEILTGYAKNLTKSDALSVTWNEDTGHYSIGPVDGDRTRIGTAKTNLVVLKARVRKYVKETV